MTSTDRPASKWLKRKDGSTLVIKIEPVFKPVAGTERGQNEYLLYKDDFGMFDILFDKELAENANPKPEFMGRILFDYRDNWIYDGEALTVFEEEQIADFILAHSQRESETR